MNAHYAMPGFEISVSNAVLELRTEGERTDQDGHDTGRALDRMIRHARPRALLFDVRSADYLLPPSRWRERVREVARVARDYPFALVGREDQRHQHEEILAAHRSMGGRSALFTSRGAARTWLKAEMEDAA